MVLFERSLSESWTDTETLGRTYKSRRTISEPSYSITETLARILKAKRNVGSWIKYSFLNESPGVGDAGAGSGGYVRSGVRIQLQNQKVVGTVTVRLHNFAGGDTLFGCQIVKYQPTLDILETAPETLTILDSQPSFASFSFTFGKMTPYNGEVVLVIYIISGPAVVHGITDPTHNPNPNAADVLSAKWNGNWIGGTNDTKWAFAFSIAGDTPYSISDTLARVYKARRILSEPVISWLDSVIRTAKFKRVLTETVTWIDSVIRRLKANRVITESVSFLDSVARIIIQRAPFPGTKDELVRRMRTFRIHMSGNQGIPTTKQEQAARKVPRKKFWHRWNEPDI